MSNAPITTLPRCPIAARGLTLRSTCEGCSGRPPNGQIVLERGDVLARGGTPAENIFAITEGWVRESMIDAEGRRTTTRFVGPGHIVGSDALAYGVHHATLDALQRARVCVVLARNVALALTERPRLGMALAQALADDLEAVRIRVARSAQSAHDRVLSIIRELLATTPPGAWGVLPASRSDLAEALGLTLETVSRQVQQLHREGFIDVHGRHVRLMPEPRTGATTAHERASAPPAAEASTLPRQGAFPLPAGRAPTPPEP